LAGAFAERIPTTTIRHLLELISLVAIPIVSSPLSDSRNVHG
jgi:hypothetical protein